MMLMMMMIPPAGGDKVRISNDQTDKKRSVMDLASYQAFGAGDQDTAGHFCEISPTDINSCCRKAVLVTS